MDDDYRTALARYELWSATKTGTPGDIARATTLLNMLVAEEIGGTS